LRCESKSRARLRLIKDDKLGLEEDVTEDVKPDARAALKTSIACAVSIGSVVEVRSRNNRGVAVDDEC